MKNTQEALAAYMKNYGFVLPGSEIYNGLANAWDYGPLGAPLKDNLQRAWTDFFARSRPNAYRFDSGILLNPSVWAASGHLQNFSDPLVDCRGCKNRFRADKLLEAAGKGEVSENASPAEIDAALAQAGLSCPECGKRDWTQTRKFNLMFKTFQGVTEEGKNTLYLRPETAQGIFINFRNVVRTMRPRLPFAVAQTGKAFRNEITPGNFVFRTREFEQCEYELFVRPDESDAAFEAELAEMGRFLTGRIGLKPESLRTREHAKEQLSHYSRRTVDYEFSFPHGTGELWGLAHRGDYDLSVHEKASGKDLRYADPATGEKFWPHVIEHSVGLGRLLYALVADAYSVEPLAGGDQREVLAVRADLAPYPVAVYPLSNKLAAPAARTHAALLAEGFACLTDASGSVGKRYRRGDAIGVKYAVTIDFDTEADGQATVRDRDTMAQERVPLSGLPAWLAAHGVPKA